MDGEEHGIWQFALVRPDHPGGMILVNMALKPEVIHALRRQDREIWAAVLDQAECCAERILADAE